MSRGLFRRGDGEVNEQGQPLEGDGLPSSLSSASGPSAAKNPSVPAAPAGIGAKSQQPGGSGVGDGATQGPGSSKGPSGSAAPAKAWSIRSALTNSTAMSSLFSRESSSTAATSMATSGSGFSVFGKRRSSEERIQVMDRLALAESHKDAPASETRAIEIPRITGSLMAVPENPTSSDVPMSAVLNHPWASPRSNHLARTPGSFNLTSELGSVERDHMVVPPPSTGTGSFSELDMLSSRADPIPVLAGSSSTPASAASASASASASQSQAGPGMGPGDNTPHEQSVIDNLASLRSKIVPLVSGANHQNAPRLAGLLAQLFKDYSDHMRPCPTITTATSLDLVKVIQCSLFLVDTLLSRSSVRSAKMNLLSSLHTFGLRLGLVEETMGPVPLPRNYGLGQVEVMHSDTVSGLLDGISQSWNLSLEDEGAYIAPVLRGLSINMSVATLCFGFPRFSEQQSDSINSLLAVCPDVHMYGRKDSIRPASRIVPPYRIADDPKEPPISLSLAVEGAQRTSGTLGGYVHPIIDESNHDLEEYKGSTFAVTCGHVCLTDKVPEKHPAVKVPSPVLMKLFLQALVDEKHKHKPSSMEYEVYDCAITSLEESDAGVLGELTWGERVVVDSTLSDLALIKVSKDLVCRNTLGEDANMSQYDPSLLLSNLVINHIVHKPAPGLPVFKYGSTTKYTKGVLSGSRIVYWSGRKLQSSEFVVKSSSPVFASGGDSGAWILAKQSHGLGAVGMIHSYDGEFKEFGLFTPMDRILSRLQQVTGIEWGVVGVPSVNDSIASESDY